MSDVSTLYKYMPFRKEFFDNFYLRCTPRSALNDPFEVRPSNDYILEHIQSIISKPIITLQTAHMSRSSSIETTLSSMLTSTLTEIGIISFSETADNLLMWSHYANQHRGIVIEFDVESDFFQSQPRKRQMLRRVLYRKKRVTNLPVSASHKFDKDSIYFEKSDEWIYEKEHRLTCSLSHTDDILCSVEHYEKKIQCLQIGVTPTLVTGTLVSIKQIEKMFINLADPALLCMQKISESCIRSVTCGAMMPQEDKDYVKQKADELGFSYREAVIDDNEYRLNFLG